MLTKERGAKDPTFIRIGGGKDQKNTDKRCEKQAEKQQQWLKRTWEGKAAESRGKGGKKGVGAQRAAPARTGKG